MQFYTKCAVIVLIVALHRPPGWILGTGKEREKGGGNGKKGNGDER